MNEAWVFYAKNTSFVGKIAKNASSASICVDGNSSAEPREPCAAVATESDCDNIVKRAYCPCKCRWIKGEPNEWQPKTGRKRVPVDRCLNAVDAMENKCGTIQSKCCDSSSLIRGVVQDNCRKTCCTEICTLQPTPKPKTQKKLKKVVRRKRRPKTKVR